MDTTTVSSATQAQALAAAHPVKQVQAPHKGISQGTTQSRPSAAMDGDGDHGIEPSHTTGQHINVRG